MSFAISGARREMRCSRRAPASQQACLIHRVRFYLPHPITFPPSCAYTLLHFTVIFPGPRVSSYEKGGEVTTKTEI